MFFTRRHRKVHTDAGAAGVTYRLATFVSIAEKDDRAALLDLNTGRYFLLNEVGTRVCELLGEGLDVPAMVDRLEGEFDASRETLSADARSFVGELESRRLVVRS